jgi:hypothetical protein
MDFDRALFVRVFVVATLVVVTLAAVALYGPGAFVVATIPAALFPVWRQLRTGKVVRVGLRPAITWDAVEENRKVALALLPDAIAAAEAKKAQWVVLRASQKTGVVRGIQMSQVYGYVWEKDPASGAWVPNTQ